MNGKNSRRPCAWIGSPKSSRFSQRGEVSAASPLPGGAAVTRNLASYCSLAFRSRLPAPPPFQIRYALNAITVSRLTGSEHNPDRYLDERDESNGV